MTVVYVDTLFLLNLTIDYLLLRLSARICGQHVPTLRLALGALVGAVYALCAFLPQGHFLTHPLVKVAVGVALALTAFGGRQRLLRLTLVFFACACALGGGVLMVSLLGSGGLTYANGIPATGLDFKILCLSAAGSYLVLSVGMRCLGRYSKVSKEILPVTVTLDGRTVRLDALVDTGNTVVVIEHNLDVIKCADHLIDLGPEGGDGGGTIVCTGTPEEVAQCAQSYTGKYLKSVL